MKKNPGFVHLHTHTEYSFLDGAIRVPDLVERAVKFGMPALAITDHGGLFGAVEFFGTCLDKGIKPILGFEAYVAPGSRFEKGTNKDERNYHHLVLLAKDNEGWKNLMQLSTLGYTEGFYYKPRVDMELLRSHAKGVIATTACIGGAVPRALLAGNRDLAKKIALEYLEIFGEKNFYFELQSHGIQDEALAFGELIKLGHELGIPFIVANDAHYLDHEHALSHEVLLCIQTQTTMDDPKRYRFSSDQLYFKSPQEMFTLFPEMPEAYANTLDIAERCNVDIKSKPRLPTFSVPENYSSAADYLRALAHEGLQKKYAHVTPGLRERLDFELDVICKMEFAGYFLIVADFVDHTKKEGIMVGARGSAAGSLVAHVLGITDVDPIRYDLLFERFLNPERISMPDADIDFADKDRGKVIDYVINRYGREAVSQIINFGRMKAKMAVKDVARAMGIPLADANRLSGMIAEKNIEKSVAANGELKRTVEGNSQFKELFRHAQALEGLARQAGMHAGGVIIAQGNVVDYSPLFKQPGSDILMTQFDMNFVEKVGLIKMDFLGLRTLTVLQETVNLITRYHGTAIDLWKIPIDDPKTYELFGNGETVGVFQFESQGMQDYLRKLKPTNIDDIIAMVALYRPGPMDNIDPYIHRKHGKEKVSYPHPMLAEILDVTNGVIIYQEQVMRIAQHMGGFTLGEADVLRKAMGKKKLDVMEEMRKKFLEGAVTRKIEKKTANDVFDLMAKFAEYGFNKSHAASYAHVAYQSAFLKAHYTLEYLTANLTSNIGDQDDFLKQKIEAERMGIGILPPDINASEDNCSIENGKIRLGLLVIKNVGQAAGAILEARREHGPFASIYDLCKRADLHRVNRKCLESLIYAGALDCLHGTRAQLFTAVESAVDFGATFQKDRMLGQTNLFDDIPAAGGGKNESAPVMSAEPRLPDTQPWPYAQVLQKEKELLSFYVSGHPLERFRDEIQGFATMSLREDQIATVKDGAALTVGGIITVLKPHMQNNGKQMAFLTIEDFDGSVELLVFGDVFEKFRSVIAEDAMVLVHGIASRRENEDKPKIKVDNCIALTDSREKLTRSVHVRLNAAGLEKDFLETIKGECVRAAGACNLIVHIITAEGNEYRVRSRTNRVSPLPDFIAALRNRAGKENVWISKAAA